MAPLTKKLTQKNYTKIEANFSVDGCLLACEKLTTITN